ncbi:MAG: thioredoxin-disulfide reductase [Thermoplasmata archaeon]|nr:thioredoxin-disulfide reductase [Thermoplasmata archaeon]
MPYDYDIAIIGAGAAGYSAAIYAGRSGASAVIFDKGMGGGLTSEADEIENYPGFKKIKGPELMERMKEHASQYAKMHFLEEVKDLKVYDDGIDVISSKRIYKVGAVILCTGTEHRKLGVKGEEEFRGRGVSYCATCDGPFFVGKDVVVVGGGNTAISEAIYLKDIGCNVTVIHRRDELRAEKILEDEAKQKGVNFIWNSVVEEIFGDEMVKGVKIKNVKTGEIKEIKASGVFVSIGEEPNNELAKKVGAQLDEHGYVKVDRLQRTSVKRVYAAGDITGGVRQIVTACGEGATAALASLEVIGKRNPFR